LRIGIFGGTFNPPHIGHELSAKTAARQLGLDLLIVVPAGTPPHKSLPAGSPSAQMRLNMTNAAFKDALNVVVSDFEIKNAGPGYTIDTVLAVKEDYPGAELFLLTGTDMYLSLEKWRDSNALLETVTPAVFSRSSDDMRRIADFSQTILQRYGVRTETVLNKVVEISSSELREMLPRREGTGYIADTNYSYIIRHRLYGARPDWDWLRARAYSMLSPARIPHVDGCEQEALRLAARWGADPDDARESAILHDITKRLSPEENISILEENGEAVGELEFAGEKLLHSKTGAVLAKAEFGVSQAVADAIMWHTTGRAGMSVLEKIIYIADYIEPMRDFEGVEQMRKLAYESLDKAMKMGLEMSVEDMTARGIVPNRTTFDALGDLDI
jgi:nicotinate-nucleotide adenylyltransferase